VLVADSGRARVFSYRSKPAQFNELRDFRSASGNRPSRDLVSDGSGRSYNVQGPGAHSKTSRSDAHDRAEEQFAASMAEYLQNGMNADAFDRLAIIADPRTLGRLRRNMGKALAGRISTERASDLTGWSVQKLEQRVREVL
jgi:protein required for attachment to host cells